jgi:hypothetical protein
MPNTFFHYAFVRGRRRFAVRRSLAAAASSTRHIA